MLLIVMYGSRLWRVRPGETFTFGRSRACSVVLHATDRGLSRTAGSLCYHDGAWWVHNDSHACLLFVSGDRGFRADLPPGTQIPLQQWHAKIRFSGVLGDYTLRLRLPDLDDEPEQGEPANSAGPAQSARAALPGERAITSIRYRPRLTESDRLVLAARFENYLTWRYAGVAAPRTARETAQRIGWQPHAVTKRCENIRDRYARLGVPGLHGPRALEELAALLISTGQLTAEDLRRLPAKASTA